MGMAVPGSQHLDVLDAETLDVAWSYGHWEGFQKAWDGLRPVAEGKGFPLPASLPPDRLTPWAPTGAVLGDRHLNVRWWYFNGKDGIVVTGVANPKTSRLLVSDDQSLVVIWASSPTKNFDEAWMQVLEVVAGGGFKMPVSIQA